MSYYIKKKISYRPIVNKYCEGKYETDPFKRGFEKDNETLHLVFCCIQRTFCIMDQQVFFSGKLKGVVKAMFNFCKISRMKNTRSHVI